MRAARIRKSTRATLIAFLMMSALFVVPTHSQTITPLYSFSNQTNSGSPQEVALVQGRDGELYGTSLGNDNDFSGSIFKVSVSRVFKELYSFSTSNACCPGEGMTLASDGNFYGVAPDGGNEGNGLLFKIAPNGDFTALHYFTGSSDGANPFAPPIQASDGNLYGTTGNGVSGATVYKYTISGSFSTIYQFSGAYVGAPLIQASDGFLYGTTANGGWAQCGTIFKMSTAGALLRSYPFPCKAGGLSLVTLHFYRHRMAIFTEQPPRGGCKIKGQFSG